jgi:hypothetical protein
MYQKGDNEMLTGLAVVILPASELVSGATDVVLHSPPRLAMSWAAKGLLRIRDLTNGTARDGHYLAAHGAALAHPWPP